MEVAREDTNPTTVSTTNHTEITSTPTKSKGGRPKGSAVAQNRTIADVC